MPSESIQYINTIASGNAKIYGRATVHVPDGMDLSVNIHHGPPNNFVSGYLIGNDIYVNSPVPASGFAY